MSDKQKVLKFELDEYIFALPIQNVTKIIRAVEVTTVPQAPENILGVINYHGVIIPVINIRHCFGLPSKEVDPDQRFLIVNTGITTLAIIADSANDIIMVLDSNSLLGDSMLQKPELREIVRLEDGMLFICDLEQLLKTTDLSLIQSFLDKAGNEFVSK